MQPRWSSNAPISVSGSQSASAAQLSQNGVPVSGEKCQATISREGAANQELTADVVRQAAALDESARLGTLFLAARDSDELMLGEFVSVQISGAAADDTYRVPAASLTSGDQLWVVEAGKLREREVVVIGNEDSVAVVRNFDIADGVVTIPPSAGRDGLPVTIHSESRHLAGGGGPIGAQ